MPLGIRLLRPPYFGPYSSGGFACPIYRCTNRAALPLFIRPCALSTVPEKAELHTFGTPCAPCSGIRRSAKVSQRTPVKSSEP